MYFSFINHFINFQYAQRPVTRHTSSPFGAIHNCFLIFWLYTNYFSLYFYAICTAAGAFYGIIYLITKCTLCSLIRLCSSILYHTQCRSDEVNVVCIPVTINP